jgi:hypothetical protein
VGTHNVFCNPAEISHVEQEMVLNPRNVGVGVVDKSTGQVRLFSYDETNAFSMANPRLTVAAGHEAAAEMAGIPSYRARGFVLVKQGNAWNVFNQSHLNRPDGQTNTMRMDDQLFNEIVTALLSAGIQNPVVH